MAFRTKTGETPLYDVVPCSKIDTLPNISFVIAGKAFTIGPHDYISSIFSGLVCVTQFGRIIGGTRLADPYLCDKIRSDLD